MGSSTYLADSMQFMLELGCRVMAADCYYVMPSFRGEDGDETHLSQFFHSEAEIHGSLDDAIRLVNEYLGFLAAGFLDRHGEMIATQRGRIAELELLASGDGFERVTFDEASRLLDGEGIVEHEGWRTITRAGELQLVKKISPFTWVTHFDHLSVPFYQAFGDGEMRTALCGDLLMGIGEVVGAGERHMTASDARAALIRHEVDESPYAWYLDMRDKQPIRTSGFGLGVERLLMWMIGHNDIRDMQIVPRVNGMDILP